MPGDYDDQLLKEGILHYKAGEFSLARRFLERALDSADDFQTRFGAYFHLALLSADPAKKREYLEEALVIDPLHAAARRALAVLDGRLKPEEIIDSDVPLSPLPEQVAAQADRFNCPKCGGRMVYAPDGRALVCEYCARSQFMGGEIAPEQDFFVAMASSRGHRSPVSVQVLHCSGCGAEFFLEAQELSFTCAYCGSAQVVRQDRTLLTPDAVIPFGFSLPQAQEYLAAWLHRKRLTERLTLGLLRPLYLPVWTFSLAGSIPWSGQVYRNKRMVTTSGEVPAYFNNIAVPATEQLPRLLPRLLETFDFTVTAPFDVRYLAGWPAGVQELSLSQAALEARRMAVERVRLEVRLDVGWVDDLRYHSSAISVDTFKLVLVPAWLADLRPTRPPQRLFSAAVNGATGAVCGDW